MTPRRRSSDQVSDGLWRRGSRALAGVVAVIALLGAVAAAYGAIWYAPAKRRQALAQWEARLGAAAQNRRSALEGWVAAGLGDAQTLATFPSVVRLLAEPGNAVGETERLREVFEQIVANKGLAGAWLLDLQGRALVRAGVSSRGPSGPSPEAVVRFATMVAAGALSLDLMVNEGGSALVLLGSPVWHLGTPVGAAVIQVTAASALNRVVGEATPAGAGDVQVVSAAGDSVLYLLAGQAGPVLRRRAWRPALSGPGAPPPGGCGGAQNHNCAGPGIAAVEALAGAEVFGEFEDHVGRRVVAAGSRLRNAPWAVLAQVPFDEALAPYRGALLAYAGGAAGFVTAAALGLLLLGNLHRRSLESERREGEARLRRLAANAGDIIYRYRLQPQPACEYINPAVTRITGYTPEECYADPFLPRRRVHPADAEQFRDLIAAPRPGEPSAFRWLHRDGSERMLELLNIPVRDAAGDLVAIEGVARDVTRLYQQELALRRSEERHRTLFENLAQGIVYLDCERQRITSNAAAEELLGLSGEQLQHLDSPAINGFEEDGTPLTQATLPASVALETGRTVPQRLVRLFNHRDGRYRWVFIGSRPLRYREDGEVFAIYTTLTDISALREAEQELRDTRELYRQAQKMEAVGRLAGGVAHDFNNLITAIKGYAALLAKALPEGSPTRNDAAEIGRAADRAATLTRQLLAFGRKQVLELRTVRLDAIVRELEQMLRRVIGEDITLVLESQQELWPVLADVVQVEQVLLNLVVNSRDAMHRGGRLEIQLRNVIVPPAATGYVLPPGAGEYVAMSVADTGSGMSTETLQHIFEPFFTTKEVGQGTGLGLPTVYGIVQQSDGGIRVDSVAGEGTVFEILLPRASLAAEQTAAPPPARPAGPGGERILVVEDEAPLRELMRRLLESAGYVVNVAANGHEALALAVALGDGIDLLLTDVLMPGMSGSALAAEFLARFPDGRVLYTSGYSDEFSVQQRVVDPRSALLQKPFTQESLERAVRNALDSAPLTRRPA